MVTIAVSLVVLLAWVPLRETPGLGTITNAFAIGLATNLGPAFLHEPRRPRWLSPQVADPIL